MPASSNPETPTTLSDTDRARARADVEKRINDARAIVLAKDDGVVTRLMTDLEREWLALR